METIYAPNTVPNQADLFLAGGITNCPDWQSDATEQLKNLTGVILNPRRPYFPDNPKLADEQITWEYHALRKADTVLFWFPQETLCPITLLELGVFTQRKNTKLIVGTHPNYQRKFDVTKQLQLARPEVIVYDDLTELINAYKENQ